MIADLTDEQLSQDAASSLLAKVAAEINSKPFVPHRLITKGDAQTIGAFLWPARLRLRDETDDEHRLFEVASDTKVLARCRWQADRSAHPTLVMSHGMEGSVASAYMLTTAAKAFGAGFNVVRVNIRNCGGTEHLTPTLYHGGLTSDLRAIIDELINQDRLPRIVLAGFSLGGNKVVKLAAEYGEDSPPELKGVCAVSPSINLRAGCDLLMQPRNWIYQRDFLYYLKRRIKAKQKLFPDLYDTTGLGSIRTLEQYDARYIAPGFGFADVNDYYAKASALPLIGRILIPTMIIHAADDPFIPVAPLRDPAVTGNPCILLIVTERGGHVAFVSANPVGKDRFWAENRLVQFCGLAGELVASR
jgi:predicted alpha/beta-fold hydrolase